MDGYGKWHARPAALDCLAVRTAQTGDQNYQFLPRGLDRQYRNRLSIANTGETVEIAGDRLLQEGVPCDWSRTRLPNCSSSMPKLNIDKVSNINYNGLGEHCMSSEPRIFRKRVIVTGSGTGIGREIALEFGRQGADVALHYAHSDAGARSAAEEIRAMGREAAAFGANFEKLEEVFRFAECAMSFLGGVDCLINNSGITFNKPLLKITPEQYDVVYNVNVRAQFFMMQRAVAYMVEHGGGAIVNLTSVHGLAGAPEHSVYAGTKGAIIAQTRTLGIELAHKGVRVNAIAPGWIVVENHGKAITGRTVESAMEAARDAVPAGRPGFPVEIAKLAVFLCSDDAQYIIGQTIVADGGTTAMMSLIRDFRHESAARFGTGYVPGA